MFPIFTFSQNFVLLDKIQSVEVYYRLTKLESSKKNDNYLFEVMYKNTALDDLFYNGIPSQGKSEPIQEFAKINLPNVTKVKNDNVLYLFGEMMASSTNDKALLIIRSKKEFSSKTEIETSIGVVPEINLVKVLNFNKEPENKKPANEKVTLNEGLIIKAALVKNINGSNLSIGDKIDFELDQDIVINNYIVVRKGAKILGTVTDAKGSRMLGKKGKLAFTIDFMYLPDGKVLKLRSQVTKQLQGSGVVVAGASVLLTPFALFINGKNAKYQRGDIFDTYLDETIEL